MGGEKTTKESKKDRLYGENTQKDKQGSFVEGGQSIASFKNAFDGSEEGEGTDERPEGYQKIFSTMQH